MVSLNVDLFKTCPHCETPDQCQVYGICTKTPLRDLLPDNGIALPEGETGMPQGPVWAEAARRIDQEVWDTLSHPVQRGQPSHVESLQQSIDNVESLKRAPTPGFVESIKVYPQDQQDIILAWYPHIYLRPSMDGQIVSTPYGILEHARLVGEFEEKQRKQLEKDDAAERRELRRAAKEGGLLFATQWKAWRDECAARKRWIEEQKAEWRKRVEQRRIAMDQWDLYVKEARDAAVAAAQTVPPVVPVKSS